MKVLETNGVSYTTCFQFSCSGRIFSANLHILGLSPDLQVHEGFDGDLPEASEPPTWWLTDPEYADCVDTYFTPNERLELAEYMIDLWGQYKAAIPQPVA